MRLQEGPLQRERLSTDLIKAATRRGKKSIDFFRKHTVRHCASGDRVEQCYPLQHHSHSQQFGPTQYCEKSVNGVINNIFIGMANTMVKEIQHINTNMHPVVGNVLSFIQNY